MLFNSFDFLLFFLAFYPVFLALPGKRRWIWLLLSSLFFYYSFKPVYVLLLVGLAAVDYFCAIAIEKSFSPKKKIFFLVLCLVSNIGTLAVFKYLGFFGEIISLAAGGNPFSSLAFVLPIGISFHTFQGMGYAIDVFRGSQKAERNFGIFALYISIFPQLVAGPIERAKHLIPQLKTKFLNLSVNVREAGFLIAMGYFKKVAIADNLAKAVDPVYLAPGEFSGAALAIATVFFGFQLYCDFSGYIDIARGIGKLIGIDFVENFNKPYFSQNISEFWRRWHISLSSWVRDYIYIPLGGNRKGIGRQYFNLAATMVIMGLWHGAGFNFAFWGLYHGILLALHKFLSAFGIFAMPKFIKIAFTFIAVNVGWIFFRGGDIAADIVIVKKIFGGSLFSMPPYQEGLPLGFILIASLVILEALDLKFNFKKKIIGLRPVPAALFYAGLLYLFVFLADGESLSFIYSQF